MNPDTDDDGMPDNWEQNFNGYNGTTPLVIWMGSVQYDYLNPLVDDATNDTDNAKRSEASDCWLRAKP